MQFYLFRRVQVEGPSPPARAVRKVIEANNPAWRVPAGRRVAKFVKKHEQTTAKSSSTVSSEDDNAADDDLNLEVSNPPVTSRRGMLALGASLSVRRLLSGSANNHQPRRELKSKLSFRKKKLQVAGKRPSLTHVPVHDETVKAAPAPPSTVSSPLSVDDRDVTSFVSDDELDDVEDVVSSDQKTKEMPTQDVATQSNDESIAHGDQATAGTKTAQDLVPDAASAYQDDNDGKIHKGDVCGGCMIM